jgi:hypothetical protein
MFSRQPDISKHFWRTIITTTKEDKENKKQLDN